MAKSSDKGKKQSNAEKPISLKPLEFDEAVADLLKVKPEDKAKREGDQDDRSKAET